LERLKRGPFSPPIREVREERQKRPEFKILVRSLWCEGLGGETGFCWKRLNGIFRPGGGNQASILNAQQLEKFVPFLVFQALQVGPVAVADDEVGGFHQVQLEQYLVRLVKIGHHDRGGRTVKEGLPSFFSLLDEIVDFLDLRRLLDISDLLGALFEVVLANLDFGDFLHVGKGNIPVEAEIPDPAQNQQEDGNNGKNSTKFHGSPK
jgi:hypothetical protein